MSCDIIIVVINLSIMKLNGKFLIIVLMLAVLTAASIWLVHYWSTEAPLGPDEDLTGPISDVEIKPQDVQEMVASNNRFALDLYSLYREREEGNIFYSPYSLLTALTMTYEGARGQTAEEMASVFYLPDDQIRWGGMAGLYNTFNQNDREYALDTANAIWPATNYHFLDDYFSIIERYYRGRIESLDYPADPEGSRLTINQWVEDQTRDKIKDLIPAGLIDPLTRLVLTNAIYFKGQWLTEFDQDLTEDAPFYLNDDQTVTVPMMRRTDDEAIFDYARLDDLEVLSLPYRGEEVAMTIILPDQDKFEAVEASLDLDKINYYRSQLEPQRIDLYLPRFKIETKYFMNEDLADLGMPSAFSAEADFSGMTGNRDLFISAVIHQAFAEVNEEGTEAAAATAVVMLESAAIMSPVFRVDRPFIFLIEHLESGTILFMGRVSNPS